MHVLAATTLRMMLQPRARVCLTHHAVVGLRTAALGLIEPYIYNIVYNQAPALNSAILSNLRFIG